MQPELNSIVNADAITFLKSLPENSVHCCVTSPPYYALRSYKAEGIAWEQTEYTPIAGMDSISIPCWQGELGFEPSIEMFIGHLVSIFRELWRVLRDDGVFWLNMGDVYNGSGKGGWKEGWIDSKQKTNKGSLGMSRHASKVKTLKPKDLMMIPDRTALALQADGWYLRSDSPWIKVNAMPSPQKDRFTIGHEHLFQLTKSRNYFFNHGAIRKPESEVSAGRSYRTSDLYMDVIQSQIDYLKSLLARGARENEDTLAVVNAPTKPIKADHYAGFPTGLVQPLIMATCPPGGTVLDMFFGTGTTGCVARSLGVNFYGGEISPEYAAIASERLRMSFDEKPTSVITRDDSMPLFQLLRGE